MFEAGHYSYRINYVPDAPNAFVPCSTPDFAFTVTLDEAQAREMVLQQCTDPGLGYDGLEGQGFTFSYNCALPRGTTLSQADGKIYGTITEAVGSYGPYRLKVAMDGMESMFGELLSFTIAPANVVNFNQGTPDAKVGQPYHIQFGFTGIGGNVSYSFDPPLPAWLVRNTPLDPAKYGYAYNGTPTASGEYTGVATITSACGVKDSAPFRIRTLP